MPAWLSIIGGVIQIIVMVLKNKFEQDAEERKRKNDLHADWKDVVKSGNPDAITNFLNKLHT